MATATDLRVEKRKTWEQMRKMLDTAEKSGKRFSPDEEREYGRLEARCDRLTEDVAEAEGARDAKLDRIVGAMDRRGALENMERDFEKRLNERVETGEVAGVGAECRSADGQPVYVTRPGQALPGANGNVSIGRLVRSMLDARFAKDLSGEERGLLSAGVGSAGGVMLPSPVSGNLLAVARDRTVIARNATWVSAPSGKVTFAGIDADPVAQFVGETAALPEGTATFRGIDFDCKKVGVWIPISKKLARSSNAVQVIEDSLTYAVARALDSAILYGAAGASLNGLDSNADVTSADGGSVTVSVDKVTGLLTDIYTANPPDMKYLGVVNAELYGSMNALKDGEGQYLLSQNGGTPPLWGNIRWEVSNIIPTAATLTDLWLLPANGRGILVAYLAESEILVSETAANGSRSAFTSDEVWVRCVSYLDVAAEKAAWVGRLYDVKV